MVEYPLYCLLTNVSSSVICFSLCSFFLHIKQLSISSSLELERSWPGITHIVQNKLDNIVKWPTFCSRIVNAWKGHNVAFSSLRRGSNLNSYGRLPCLSANNEDIPASSIVKQREVKFSHDPCMPKKYPAFGKLVFASTDPCRISLMYVKICKSALFLTGLNVSRFVSWFVGKGLSLNHRISKTSRQAVGYLELDT